MLTRGRVPNVSMRTRALVFTGSLAIAICALALLDAASSRGLIDRWVRSAFVLVVFLLALQAAKLLAKAKSIPFAPGKVVNTRQAMEWIAETRLARFLLILPWVLCTLILVSALLRNAPVWHMENLSFGGLFLALALPLSASFWSGTRRSGS
jgi:hypothetical protein